MQDDKDRESGSKGDRSKSGKSDLPQKLADSARVPPSTDGGGRQVIVSFGPKFGQRTPDEDLWVEIQRRVLRLSFSEYSEFVDSILCSPPPGPGPIQSQGPSDSVGSGSGHGHTFRGDLKHKLRNEL